MKIIGLALATALLAAAPRPADAPRPATPRTFTDWAVACDNVRRCTMASLSPESGDTPGYTVVLARAAGPTAGYELAIGTLADDARRPTRLTIDAQSFVLARSLVGPAAQRLASAIARGRTLRLFDARGRPVATVSLAGAAAALRFIDAEQGRAGTVTATVATGPRPATAVPLAPAAPVIAAPALGNAPAALSPKQIAAMKRTARCEAPPFPDSDWRPQVYPVGAGASLVVLPCSTGAYNLIGAVFVVRGSRVEPARADAPAGFAATGADPETPVTSVVNARVENGVLSSYAKGRGLGDCGMTQRFAWDGTRLRLIEQAEMRDCRGNPTFLRTWTARVERR